MKRLSIDKAYMWAQHFAVREWRLLLPIAFAFMVLPPLTVDLLVPRAAFATLEAATRTQDAAAALAVLTWLAPLQLIMLLLMIAGGLAITALALHPAISVREALMLAARRLGVLIGALFLLTLGAFLLALVFGILIASARVGPAIMQSLLSGLLLGIALLLGSRLVPLLPIIACRRVGPISAIRESWFMTKGASLRIFGAIIIYLVGAIIVMLALSTGVGAILVLLGNASGLPDLSAVLLSLFSRSIAALLGVGSHLLAVGLYRQLAEPNNGT